MKNLFLVPTPDETRVAIKSDGFLFLTNHPYPNSPKFANHHIYITNNEKPKDGDWCLPFMNGKLDITEEYPIYKMKNGDFYCEDKKIILTDDTELINDGVQSINDEFLEWFVNNQSCEEVDILIEKIPYTKLHHTNIFYNEYKIIIPKEEHKQDLPKFGTKEFNDLCYKFMGGKSKQETLEEVCNKINFINPRERVAYYNGLKNGAKYQQEQDKNKYSEEEIIPLLNALQYFIDRVENGTIKSKTTYKMYKELLEQFKKK